MDSKYYLFRDHGMILFSSFSNNKSLFWLSFLSGGHIDWTYYIQITELEFFDVWRNKITIRELYKKYSNVRIHADESETIEKRYKLKAAIELHKMPSAIEQMHFKSEVPKNNLGQSKIKQIGKRID